MPIYGYRCTNCGREVEVLQSMSAAPLTVCENCGGRLEKKLYPVGVVFKGSGFYSTDYKRSSANVSETSEKKGDASPSSSESSTPAKKDSSSGGSSTEKSSSGSSQSATAKAADS